MTFAWFTFVAGVIVGVIIGYFVSSSRLETKFIKNLSSLKDQVDILKKELHTLKDALIRSEEERENLVRFNIFIPEIIRKLSTAVLPEDIPFISVRSVKNFFNARVVAFFTGEKDGTFVLSMGTGYPEELNGSVRIKPGEGIVGIALEQVKTINAADYAHIERYSRVSPSEFEKAGLKADLVAPVTGVDGVYGAVALAGIAFRVHEEKRYLSMIGDIIGLSYDKAKRTLEGEIGERDQKDEVCDVYTRGYFGRRLVSELKKAENYVLPLSLLLLEIDEFEGIHEKFGDEAGKVVVRSVAKMGREKTRRADFVARFDTGTIAIVMIASTKEQAFVHGKRLCDMIGSMKIPLPQGEEFVTVTVSGGVSSYHIDGDQPSDLIESAQNFLSLAKSRGGNRVVKSEVELEGRGP